MSSSERDLRSKARSTSTTASLSTKKNTAISPVIFASSPSAQGNIRILQRGSELPGLTKSELALLRKKQARLGFTYSSERRPLRGGSHTINALGATLIFAQHEAGTAVCIDAAGWILTCSHCFGETEVEWKAAKRKWLLFHTGLAVQVECRVWDPKRDLALAKVIAIESDQGKTGDAVTFCFVSLSASPPSIKTPILCIGQPGSEDLESADGAPTKYDLVEVSRGVLRGMVREVDPQDNLEIGTLKHDAWTYWGHSGAPILRQDDGTLVGLHSSWDDKTAMRHGIPHVAIETFLQLHFFTLSS